MKNSERTLEQIKERRTSQRTEGYKMKKRLRDERYRRKKGIQKNEEKLCVRCGKNKRGKSSVQICQECRDKEETEKELKKRKKLSPEEAKRDGLIDTRWHATGARVVPGG